MREIESLPALHAALGARVARRLRLQDLDLTGHEDALLARTDVEGMVVLGGRIPQALDAHLRAHGALVFPTDPRRAGQPLPLDALPAARAVRRAGGARVRRDTGRPGLPLVARRRRPARRLRHPAAGHPRRLVTDALDEFVDGVPTVGVMGGHALARDTARYLGAALLGHRLATAGLAVVTGGGPGAMEAANLGAFAPDEAAVEDAVRRLAAVPVVRARRRRLGDGRPGRARRARRGGGPAAAG